MEITALFALEAEELLDQGKIDEAIELCLKGLEAFPDYPSGKIVLARAYKMNGQEDKAEENFKKVMEARPNFKMLKSIKEKDFKVPKRKEAKPEPPPAHESEPETNIESDLLVSDANESSSEIIDNEVENIDTFNLDSSADLDDSKSDNEAVDPDDIDNLFESLTFSDENDSSSIDEINIEEASDSENEFPTEITEFELDDEPNNLNHTDQKEVDNSEEQIEESSDDELLVESEEPESQDSEDFDLKNAFEELDKQIEEIEINSRDKSLISGLESFPTVSIKPKPKERTVISKITLPEIAPPEIIKKKSLSGSKDLLQMSLRNIREEGALEELGIKSEQQVDNEIPVTILNDDYDYEIFTETIAQIYVQQGAIKKAKEVYKKLIENEPEKEEYFLSKIKSL